MPIYSYAAPRSPGYKKPTSVEDCLPQARLLVEKEYGRAALGPVKKGDNILIVTYADQDEYVKEAVIQALKEKGAERVDFMFTHELTGRKQETATVEAPWIEIDKLRWGRASGSATVADRTSGIDMGGALREYLDKHPYTTLFWDTGGRRARLTALKEHGPKLRGNWVFNNWEEFLSKAWTYPDELWREIEKRLIEPLGQACAVRKTDPEGTYLEFPLTEDEAKRWQMTAYLPGHLLMNPLQATAEEGAVTTHVSDKIPPVIPDLNGVLAGTANHFGFLPRIELYFEHGLLVEVKGGGRYGEAIGEMMEQYKNVRWPAYPGKGFFWFCDCALCTVVKSFRRRSDMFGSYWRNPNTPERNRAGIFHMGFGSRRHGEEHRRYALENKLPMGHIHVHNYFVTYEIKIRGTNHWHKIVDKGWLTCMDDSEVRAIATKSGDPNELLSYDWVPPLPGINCEGNYLKDYAPDPIPYLKKRLQENKPI
jgi:hypothetical protein